MEKAGQDFGTDFSARFLRNVLHACGIHPLLPRKVSVPKSVRKKLTQSRQHILKNSSTEFHRNPSNRLVADTTSSTDDTT